MPLVKLSPPSLLDLSSLQPLTSPRGRQAVPTNMTLSARSKTIDPHVLAMGTSPPFSMMPDFTANLKPRVWSIEEAKSEGKEKLDGVESREESVYWPWGGQSIEPNKSANGGEGEEARKERMMLLDGIREKSTNSPPGDSRRVSSPGGRKSSPVMTNEGQKSLGVISPQPRGKQDWSKVGSGWMNKSPSPRESPSTTPPVSPPPTILSSGSSTPTPKSSTSATSTPTPTQALTSVNAIGPTQSQQDSIYQAFVRQWCFAQGPSDPVVASPRYTTPGSGTGEYGYSVQQLPQRRRGGQAGTHTSATEKRTPDERSGDGPLVV
jgi:hypothetical protein